MRAERPSPSEYVTREHAKDCAFLLKLVDQCRDLDLGERRRELVEEGSTEDDGFRTLPLGVEHRDEQSEFLVGAGSRARASGHRAPARFDETEERSLFHRFSAFAMSWALYHPKRRNPNF
jgi:hypothetical protein